LTALVIHSASKAGDAEALAGRSSDKKVNWAILIGSDRGEIAMQRRVGVMVCQDGAGERLNLAEGGGRPSERMPGTGRGLDAAAHTEIAQGMSAFG
jgi:hypothetical protein